MVVWPGQIEAQDEGARDVQNLIDQARSKHEETSDKLLGYTFTLKRTEQELNEKGGVKREQVKTFQVFASPHGAAINVLLSEDGKDLPPDRLAEEKRQANREWQKQLKESARKTGRAKSPGVGLLFQTAEFTYVGTQSYKGRGATVLKFEPLGYAKAPKHPDDLIGKLEGEMWIDAKEHAIVRLDARLAKGVRYFSGLPSLFSTIKPGAALVIESEPLDDGLWVIKRVEYGPAQVGTTFSKGRRDRQKLEMSGYRRFDAEADRLF